MDAEDRFEALTTGLLALEVEAKYLAKQIGKEAELQPLIQAIKHAHDLAHKAWDAHAGADRAFEQEE